MPTIRLNAKKLARLRATGTQTDFFDQAANVPGFGIRVSAAGRRVWFLLYRANGRLKRHTLGTNPPMKLEAARTAARRQLLSVQVEDADPVAAKKARRSADTFDTLADRFIADYAKPHKASWDDDARMIRTMCLARWKGKAAVDITRADVRDLLRDVAKTRGGITANRLRSCLSKLFRWSVSQDYLPANPGSDLPKLAKETGRERVLTDDEIRAFWQKADAAENPAIGLWLKLRLLTGQRGSTLLKMKWADVDFDRAIWEVPGPDMKARNPHVVPLAPMVSDLLRAAQISGGSLPKDRWVRSIRSEPTSDLIQTRQIGCTREWVGQVRRSMEVTSTLPARVTGKDGKSYPATRAENPKLDQKYVLDGGRARRLRLGVTELIGLDDFQPRDLRRTAATGMARCGAPRFIVARVLGHVDRSVTNIYDRFEYLEEKRAALTKWADELTRILNPSEE